MNDDAKIQNLVTQLDAVREQVILQNGFSPPPPRNSKMTKHEIFEQLEDLRMKRNMFKKLNQNIKEVFGSS